ncbi:SpoIIE family protein phosphatase [candidate division KSB1 bacterium]|nr:SpoIIE family protein phosphatase [candidate division KSB1 bacterium]
MLLQLTDFNAEPLYRQISHQVGERIRRGELSDGTSLEPVRTLARRQRVSVHTVERAYQELLKEGLIECHQNHHYLVTPLRKRRQTSCGMADIEIPANGCRGSEEEIGLARRIQAKSLPAEDFRDENITIAARTRPCESLGGDMYDYFRIDHNRYGVVIADACGHGVPAALLISHIQVLIKSEVKNGTSLEEMMHFINSHIRTSFIKGKFVTLFYGILDVKTWTMIYVNAGHNFPLLVRKTGEYEFLNCSSPALGLYDDIDFAFGLSKTYPGDLLLLYTDGITEAMNDGREEFGERRLLDIVIKNRASEPAQIIASIQRSLSSFVSASCHDDRTLLLLHINEITRTSSN